MVMFKRLANNIKGKHLKIVFPEANDKRVLGAAVRLRVDDLVEPILLGNVAASRQIESARVAATRYMKREGQLWIKIFPDKPITKKPLEVRMGKAWYTADHAYLPHG